MTLLTSDGRYNRTAILARAKVIRCAAIPWNEAQRRAYAEAANERRISLEGQANEACCRLGREADRLMAMELER